MATHERSIPTQIARRTDQVLRVLAREHVLVGRALGKGLVRLAEIDGFAALGYSCLENFASQRFGISGRSAQELAWMERRLSRYPAVEDAYAKGLLSYSHTRLLLRDVRPEDEPLWALMAVRLSVAELKQALEFWKARGHAAPSEAEEAGGHPLRAPEDEGGKPHWIGCVAEAPVAIKLDLAVETVRRMHGADLPIGACLEFMMAEFLGGEGAAVWAGLEESDEDEVPGETRPRRGLNAGAYRRMWREIRLGLVEFTNRWEALNWEVPSLPTPQGLPEGSDAVGLDQHMQGVVRWSREREVHLMKLLAMMTEDGLFDLLDFTGVEHYAEERLAMSGSAAWFLVTLYRRLRGLPRVRKAFEEGTLTKAQADLVARVAFNEWTERAWIRHAASTTLKFLRQAVKAAVSLRRFDPEAFERTGGLPEMEGPRPQTCADARTEARPQTCADDPPARSAADVARLSMREQLRMHRRGELDEVEANPRVSLHFLLPHALAEMWRDVYRVCEAIFGPEVTVADCLEACADAFLKQYAPEALRSIREHAILDAHGWVCANPTCTRRVDLHVHHVDFRSHGGSDDPSNKLPLCRQCYLRLVHQGRIRVRGRVPDGVAWDLGVSPHRPPHLRVVGRTIVGGMAAPEARLAAAG